VRGKSELPELTRASPRGSDARVRVYGLRVRPDGHRQDPHGPRGGGMASSGPQRAISCTAYRVDAIVLWEGSPKSDPRSVPESRWIGTWRAIAGLSGQAERVLRGVMADGGGHTQPERHGRHPARRHQDILTAPGKGPTAPCASHATVHPRLTRGTPPVPAPAPVQSTPLPPLSLHSASTPPPSAALSPPPFGRSDLTPFVACATAAKPTMGPPQTVRHPFSPTPPTRAAAG
jgi:hypothetical protein